MLITEKVLIKEKKVPTTTDNKTKNLLIFIIGYFMSIKSFKVQSVFVNSFPLQMCNGIYHKQKSVDELLFSSNKQLGHSRLSVLSF